MLFDAAHLQKPFRRLSKATKKTRELGDPARVHQLCTTTRRVEAILGALEIGSSRQKKNLRKALKKIRRAAGEVRDMDVLTGKAAEVSVTGERDCQVRLLQHLGTQRQKQAAKLADELKQRGKKVRRGLERYSKRIDPLLAPQAAPKQQREAEASAAARALELSSQLRKFATLGRRDLHLYRKKGKQLRYVLQLATRQDEALLHGLREMQDAIGEWHDWEELVAISRKGIFGTFDESCLESAR